MLETEQFEDVTCIKMSREMEGRALYWVAAYLVDGLLIDTGCSYTADELVKFLRDRKLDLVVNTHFHEDHIGANRLIMDTYGVKALAHPDARGLSAEEIRERLFGEGSSLAGLTGGHFSSDNMITSILSE